ncbi:tetratricopeptide repeat-containing S1 family peptidase [Rubricoccus marinus]|uniref:Serine protease n=1 Tax=Rubricoccus marinus TaxID=716817 RepID=A0A259TVJ3_9BACT|nr:tetratricopeptide repeat-containing serine protease family protein [Rubricoccus marinus]OZC01763.1 hypothetical protein BSZ36_01425 [Rubricoccus marinus]
MSRLLCLALSVLALPLAVRWAAPEASAADVAPLALEHADAPAPEAAAREAELFSTLDRRVVRVGETVTLVVELAVALQDETSGVPFIRALTASAPEASEDVALESAGPVVQHWDRGVLQLERRYTLRVLREGDLSVAPLALDLGGRTLETRRQRLRGYAVQPDHAAASVVAIVADGRQGRAPFRRVGSAWLAAPDALVTAYHVVVGAGRVRVQLPSGRIVSVRRVWALDPERDIAVLHIDPRETEGMAALPVAPPEAAGDAVAFTFGWPLANGGDAFERPQVGTAAALYTGIGPDLRTAGNAVRPGDSGGPLLDARGRVLGVVVSGRSTNGEADLLREDVCLAADPVPALRQRPSRPVPLARALRHAARALPAARAFEAATALTGPGHRPADAPRHRALLMDAARAAPQDAALQFLAGSVLEALGEDDEAARIYQGAHEAGYFPAAYALAHHHLETDPIQAERLFREIRASDAYAHLGAMGHARALVALSRWREAEDALAEVLDHEPTYAPALYLLGVVRLARGEDDAALALERRLASAPGWAASLRFLLRNEVLRPTALRPLARVRLAPEVPLGY